MPVRTTRARSRLRRLIAEAAGRRAEGPPRAARGTQLAAFLALIPILFAPHVLNFNHPRRFVRPVVFSGDEPHYLVLLNSVLNDGDLDLSNNYAAVHDGGLDAGVRFARHRALDHHSNVRTPDGSRPWIGHFTFDVPLDQWVRDTPDGPLRPPWGPWGPQFAPFPPGTPEYSAHPPGIALLAAVLWPWRGTKHVEPAAIVCSGLAVLLALVALRRLLRAVEAGPVSLAFVPLVVLAATPVWFYGRSLYTEPYLMLCVVAAYAAAIRRAHPVWPGLILAIGLHFKPTVALLAAPLALDLALRREAKGLLAFLAPLLASTAAILAQNAAMYGSPFAPPQGYHVGDPRVGIPGMFLALKVGLLPLSPIAAVALICWPRFATRHPRPALLLGAAIVLQVLLMGCYLHWHGAAAFGPRHLVPVLPLLFVPLACFDQTILGREWTGRALAAGLLGVSVLINGLAALNYDRYWDRHPGIEWLRAHHPDLLPERLVRAYDAPYR